MNEVGSPSRGKTSTLNSALPSIGQRWRALAMLKSHIAGQPHRIRQSSPRASISLRTAAQRRSRSLSESVGYSTSLRTALRPPVFACRGRAYDIGSHAAMAAGALRRRVVMRGLDPRIHLLCEKVLTKMDGLPGHKRVHARLPTRYARQ